MATKLELYNRALRNIEEEKLATVTDTVEARYRCDQVYDEGLIDEVLSHGLWNFANRTVTISYNSGVTPTFGYRYAFDKPSDYIRLYQISADEYFGFPLTDYRDDKSYWMSSLQTIYVQYISNDASWGGDIANWPQLFFKYASWYLANEIVGMFTHDEDKIERAEKKMEKARLEALNVDAMNEPPGRPASGSWTRSRRGGRRNRSDFGNTGSLTG